MVESAYMFQTNSKKLNCQLPKKDWASQNSIKQTFNTFIQYK